MAGVGNILIRVGADASDAVRELKKVSGPLDDVKSRGEKMSAGIKKAALPAAAALGAIGFAAIDAAKAAAEDEAGQSKLAGALERTTGATKAQVAASEDHITALERTTGVTDDEMRPALAKLAAATGSVTKANSELVTALDISTTSGKSLEAVTKAMAAAHHGHTAALQKLVPGLSDAAVKSKDMGRIMAELKTQTGGAAEAAGKTAAGQYKIMQVQMQELKETLGAALLPVMKEFAGILLKVTDIAGEHTTAIKVIIGVVAAFAGAILVANAALKVYSAVTTIASAAAKAYAAAQWLVNAALEANPIGLIIIALIALGAALVVAYKKSETFRDIVNGALNAVKGVVNNLADAFDAVKGAAVAGFNWITDHWKLALFAFGPVGAAIYLISENFDKIKGAASAAFNYITDVWKIASFAFGPIENAVQGIADAFHHIYNWASDAIGVIKDLIKWLGSIHVPKIHLPHVPFTAAAPGSAPAAAARAAAPYGAAPRGATLRSASSSASSGAAAGGITVNVYGALDPEGTARTIRRTLRGFDRRHGALSLVPPG